MGGPNCTVQFRFWVISPIKCLLPDVFTSRVVIWGAEGRRETVKIYIFFVLIAFAQYHTHSHTRVRGSVEVLFPANQQGETEKRKKNKEKKNKKNLLPRMQANKRDQNHLETSCPFETPRQINPRVFPAIDRDIGRLPRPPQSSHANFSFFSLFR